MQRQTTAAEGMSAQYEGEEASWQHVYAADPHAAVFQPRPHTEDILTIRAQLGRCAAQTQELLLRSRLAIAETKDLLLRTAPAAATGASSQTREDADRGRGEPGT